MFQEKDTFKELAKSAIKLKKKIVKSKIHTGIIQPNLRVYLVWKYKDHYNICGQSEANYQASKWTRVRNRQKNRALFVQSEQKVPYFIFKKQICCKKRLTLPLLVSSFRYRVQGRENRTYRHLLLMTQGALLILL